MSAEQHTVGQKKTYFKRQKGCLGERGLGTCNDCIKNFPEMALGCKNMGDFLPKKDWNRIFKNSPLYNKDVKPRHELSEEWYEDKPMGYNRAGKKVNRFGLPIGRNGI
ncbi:MAG: hypothetical protein CI952_42 [Methanohalophilus sp.]|jgi:hypothetical protein|nr:MAG: hypothetical protein CI952_42 [Methanohalophilus sp.]